jgi:hypothetical protein
MTHNSLFCTFCVPNYVPIESKHAALKKKRFIISLNEMHVVDHISHFTDNICYTFLLFTYQGLGLTPTDLAARPISAYLHQKS